MSAADRFAVALRRRPLDAAVGARAGHARGLLGWLHDEAARAGCREVHLDSGVGTERLAAHHLYFGAGYRISSHHFARKA